MYRHEASSALADGRRYLISALSTLQNAGDMIDQQRALDLDDLDTAIDDLRTVLEKLEPVSDAVADGFEELT